MAGTFGGVIVIVDVSEAVATMNKLASIMSPATANELFRRTLTDAGKRVKHIAKEDIPDEYQMSSGWIDGAVGFPRLVGSNQARVPIKTDRGILGERFAASGGAYTAKGTTVHMADGTTRQRKQHIRTRAIKAHIVKSGVSVLPDRMPSWQGGQPPFMLHGMPYTRWGTSRFPIHRIAGLGVPQPPINRSHAEMEKDIQDYMMKRLMHHFYQLFG